jgi:hypothetical protein
MKGAGSSQDTQDVQEMTARIREHAKTIARFLQTGDDQGDLYYLEDGHFSHPVESGLSLDEVKGRAEGYGGNWQRATLKERLAEDVGFLTGSADKIALIYYRPDNFIQGLELTVWMCVLLERSFLAAVQQRDKEAFSALVGVLRGCCYSLDSLPIQDALLFEIENRREDRISLLSEVRDILAFLSIVNSLIFAETQGEGDPLRQELFCLRVNAQHRMARALLACMEQKAPWLRVEARLEEQRERAGADQSVGLAADQFPLLAKQAAGGKGPSFVRRLYERFRPARRTKEKGGDEASRKGGYSVVGSGYLSLLPTGSEFADARHSPEMYGLVADWFDKNEGSVSRQLMLHHLIANRMTLPLVDLILPELTDEDKAARFCLAAANNGSAKQRLAALEEADLPRMAGYLLIAREDYEELFSTDAQKASPEGVAVPAEAAAAAEAEADAAITAGVESRAATPAEADADAVSRAAVPAEAEAATAAALILYEKGGAEDLLSFLQRLKYVFADGDGLVFIIASTDSQTAAAFRVSPDTRDGAASLGLDSAWPMAHEVAGLAASVHRGTERDNYPFFGEGPLELIRRKTT